MPNRTRVLIADDHPIFRQGLAAVIERDSKMKIVGEAENGEELLEMAVSANPQIIILDIDMPVFDGIETARELKRRQIPGKVIFLTMHKDTLILKSLRSLGVKGYVLKDSALEEILDCIGRVKKGKIYLSPALSDLILENVSDGTEDEAFKTVGELTLAEKRVLALITDSKTNREIADELFVAIRTVETHRYNICTKLGLNGAHALFKFALKNRQRILELTS